MVVRKHKLMDTDRGRVWRVNGLMKAGFTHEQAVMIEEAQTAKRILRQLDIPTVREPLGGVDAMVHYGRLAYERNR